MAEPSRHGGASGLLGIPTGLNRIKTRPDDSDPTSSRQNKQNNTGHVRFFRSKQGLRKEKKISRWLNSTLFKHSGQPKGDSPPAEPTALEFNKADKEDPRKKIRKMRENISGDSPSITSTDKASKCLKSFSQELGPKGGIQSIHPKAHSCNNFKDLLRSLRSRFDAAKEDVNRELDCFSQELLENLQKPGSLDPDEHKIAEELYVLAQECMYMTSLDFRGKCETIVQDLTVKRQICQAGLLKLLFTRVLFILTRCTRLLHFEKDSGPVNEQSLDKFRECLQSIPSVDTNWVVTNGFADSDLVNYMKPKSDAKPKIQGIDLRDWAIENRSKGLGTEHNIELKTNDNSSKQTTQVVLPDPVLGGGQFRKVDGNFHVESINRDKEKSPDDSNFVICRICEEPVPAVHLETHSYICAYADNCVSRHLDVDVCLLKLAELLEHLLELCDSSSHEPPANPEALKVRNMNSTLASEISSPTCSELRSKGMDGILEDLHEMDTACIDDSNVANFVNLKNHLLTKVYQCGPPSSNGSMGSSSSANSPRSGNFDFFWLDQNNLSEQEDMQQIINLADIARCVAGAYLSEEGSHELLLACLEDLQEIFQHSKQKSLLVDTFGSRIESLLREKYVLVCSLVDRTDIKYPESARSLLDITSQSSSTSTPSHPAHKESTCIDDFDIIKPISRGAFGKVFLARKRTTGDLFAIKVLKKLDMLRKNDIDRILAERNILIAARNPFVVRFFYSFTSVDKLYLVMEYLNGGDLYSLLIKVGCLEEAVAQTYIAELVLALEYLHSLGIVHRDLKPDNILIAHDGHIKLTDFGLSKIGLMNSTTELSAPETAQLDISDMNSKLNADMEDSHKSAVGTPDYLAPEILLGTEHGFAADWWSVGIILFEFLTGIPPFTADHPELIFDNILNRKVPWPSVPSDMSYEAQDLIDRLLVHDPNLRLGSKGASEVKAHSFFSGVDWDNLTFQNVAFVPQPDSIDDTSYFVSRYNSTGIELDSVSMDTATDSSEFHPNSGIEKMDDCGDLSEFDSSPLDLSLMNFSFKNLSQLASINHDVLLQSEKSSKGSSPCKGSKSVGS